MLLILVAANILSKVALKLHCKTGFTGTCMEKGPQLHSEAKKATHCPLKMQPKVLPGVFADNIISVRLESLFVCLVGF